MLVFTIIETAQETSAEHIDGTESLEPAADVTGGASCLALSGGAIRNVKVQHSLVTAMNTCSKCQRHINNLPPHSSKPGNISKWQRYENPNNSIIFVYSAFYDDRPAVGVTPWIRLHGVAANLTSRNITVYCQLWFAGCRTPAVVPAMVNVTGRESGYVINGVRFIQKMFSCRLPGIEPIPSHVSLVAVDPCDNSTIYLPVERPIRSEPDHEFGICVAIAFGHVPVAEFVEWIELNRLLGVTEVNVYDAGMVNMSTVFEYYTRQGLLNVHYMPPPVPLTKIDPISIISVIVFTTMCVTTM
jgi:hypothetical protein